MLITVVGIITGKVPIDASMIRQALYDADISITKACVWMADEKTGKPMDRALLERRLNGEGRLLHADLCKLPVTFWREYCLLKLCAVGLPPRVRRTIPIVLGLAAHKHMAKASLKTRRFLDTRKEQAS